MPFDFQAYDQKCAALTAEELQREWQHYTRLITGAATSTTVSGLALPLTLGVSSVGIAMAAPAIHNARKKREIIERHLQRHDARHVTRKRDVLGGAAVSGTIGVVTLGVGTMGADAVAQQGAEHGVNAIVANETAIKVVTHAALDGVGMGVEHMHTDRVKKREARKAFEKAGVFHAVDDAKANEAGYVYTASGQQQSPYGLQAQMPDAFSSRLSVVSAPPPYSPGQGTPISSQQVTQYQPTAMNVPTYHVEQGPQYATLDAKVDPYSTHLQPTSGEWDSRQYAAANESVQSTEAYGFGETSESTSNRYAAGNISSPPIPPKEAVTVSPVSTPAAANTTSGESKATDLGDLIANIDEQLKLTEADHSTTTSGSGPLSFKAGPVDKHYELEAHEEVIQPQAYQRPRDSSATEHSVDENLGESARDQCLRPKAMSAENPPIFAQPDTSLDPGLGGHSQSPLQHHIPDHGQHATVFSGQPLEASHSAQPASYHGQNHQPDIHTAQPVQPHYTAPLPDRYVPTPVTPQVYNPMPPTQYQQPSQQSLPYVPTPMTPPFYQLQPSQPQTYFPPPPPSAIASPTQPPQPVVSKRKSIMAAVALKATQTLAQHRTPSAASYNRPQYSSATPQPNGQPYVQQQSAQQPQGDQSYGQYYPETQQNYQQPQPNGTQTQQHWSHPQNHACQNTHYHQPGHSIEEPTYAPVPVPQAYSTRPQSQIFPPTPLSPPSIPTVQLPQQQQPGYFPGPSEYKPRQFGQPTNAPFSPMGQGQTNYPPRQY